MFKLPDKPGIEKADKKPEARLYCVIPYRACIDFNLTASELKHLGVLASYSQRNGFSYVSIRRIASDLNESWQNATQYLRRLEDKGYIKTHKNGMTGIRGRLRQIIFDNTLSIEDVVAISNEPLPEPIEEVEDMKRRGRPSKKGINPIVDNTLDFDSAVKLVENLIKSENDILKLERLVSQGITSSQLLAAFS